MCGILGVILKNNSKNVLNHLFKMNDIQKHRGLDDEGYTFFSNEKHTNVYGKRTPENVINSNPSFINQNNFNVETEAYNFGLSHNRLSIIDVSEKGHQPMSDISENYWITYNGEIYNFKPIRNELISLGYSFSSNTDTEVVLFAFIEWGAECVKKFNGMWSFCIYNKLKNELFFSRDRFGIKPLYYRLEKTFFAFASEQKALYHFPDTEDIINEEAVFNYLSMGLIEDDQNGLIHNIFELSPGHNLTYNLSSNEIKIDNYYILPINTKWENYNEQIEKEHIDKLTLFIEDAIKIRLQSDVSVGSCLSGGIDSSIIVGVINKLLNENNASSVGSLQKTFTSCFKNEAEDEEKWAKLVTDQTKTDWHKTYPTSHDFITDFKDLVYHQDVPFFSSSTYSQYRVMKLANENGIKVTLDGQGADEIFAGYPIFYSSYISNAFFNLDFKAIKGNSKNLTTGFSNSSTLLKSPLKLLIAKNIPDIITSKIFKSNNPEFEYINSKFWKKYQVNLSKLKQNFDPNLNSFLGYYFTSTHFKNLLRTGDRNSMRFGIESRMPFADDINLIEYCFQIPANFKIKNGVSKHLLREAEKHILPKEIYERKDKIGFATPQYNWFEEQEKNIIDLLPSTNDKFVNWIDLKENWSKIRRNNSKENQTKLWRFLNFAVWKDVNNFSC